MSQSQYLAQAIQSMSQPQGQPSTGGPSMSPQQMMQMQQQRQAWEAANPGQSYFAHGLGQMGQNLMGAPGRVADAFGSLGQLPGQAVNGLQALAQRFGGGGLPPTMDI